MANALTPGTLSQPQPAGLTGSMAQAMIDAFGNEWPNAMGSANLPASTPQMQLLFVAIAQGFVKHLYDNLPAFNISVKLEDGTIIQATISLNLNPIPPEGY